MPASPADSPLYARLFGDDEAARLFSDSAEVRAMLLVEGALAKVQGDLGVIPAESGAFLHRASFEVQIDPSALAGETAVNGVPVPALVAAFRTACNAPGHAAYAHWGATSQDIMDSALALRLKRLIALWEGRLKVFWPRSGPWRRRMPICPWRRGPMGKWPHPQALARWWRAGAG